MRAMGIDLGTRRIGVAMSNADRTLATPVTTVERGRDRERDYRRLAELADEWEVELVVVGWPRSLSGTDGPAADAVRAEVDRLRATIGRPVELYDERLTTVVAHRSLDSMGVRHDRRRAVVDQLAASVILQDWIDRRGFAADHDESVTGRVPESSGE